MKKLDGLALPTDRRFLLVSDGEMELDVPYANFLVVKRVNNRVKFATLGSDEIYSLRPTRESEVLKLADVIQNRLTNAGSPEQRQARVSAEWQMQQPIWSHRKKHNRERSKLPEIMEDGETLEGLLSGTYYSSDERFISHEGVIAATDRRLIFMSESIILDRNAGQLPYETLRT